jgi:hypothetical protein
MESLLPELAGKPFGTYGMGRNPAQEPLSVWPYWDVEQKFHQRYHDVLARLRNGDKHALGFVRRGDLLLGNMPNYLERLMCFFLGEHPRDGYHPDLDPTIPEKQTLTLLAWNAFNLAYENVNLIGAKSPPYYLEVGLVYKPERNVFLALLLDTPGKNTWKSLDMLTRYPIPPALPPVPDPVILPAQPAPWWAPKGQKGGPLVFESGDRVFVPGIYLSDPYDRLHYLNIDAPAPVLLPQDEYIDCAWTLIWPDTRYANGADIPEEEALYFPDDE